MKRNYVANSGAYTSPGTPEYGDDVAGGISRGWSSERVPLPGYSGRRHISSAALMPFNSRSALPSKWDDAERWITSPLSGGYGAFRTTALQPQRRPKSKSGPLGPPGVMQLHNYSPVVPALDGGSGRNVTIGSPFTTGVLVPEGVTIHYGVDNVAKSNLIYTDISVTDQSDSGLGLSDFVNDSSLSDSQDDKLDGSKESEAAVSRVVSRRDMATQMSPEGSTRSSRNGRLSFSAFPSVASPVELHINSPLKIEIRDVQVDRNATNTKLSEKQGHRKTRKGSSDYNDMGSPWDIRHSRKKASKLEKVEAKITAWENLQKAKAEEAIQKLEMKLEKERSASMDKILGKLRTAQMKAQEKRTSITDSPVIQSPRISRKGLFCKYTKTASLFRCCFFST